MNLLQKVKIVYDNYFFDRKIKKYSHPDFFFIQIGACDGLKFDPIRKYVLENDWNGILVEPTPHNFDLLQKNYKQAPNLIFENAAITQKDGEIEMYTISPEGYEELPDWAVGISSIHNDKNALSEEYWKSEKGQIHAKNGYSYELIEKHKKKINVNALTLVSLLEKHQVKRVDLLVIDTEGHDYPILQQLSTINIKPKLIRFEINNMSPEELSSSYKLLRSLGYKNKVINGFDCISWLK